MTAAASHNSQSCWRLSSSLSPKFIFQNAHNPIMKEISIFTEAIKGVTKLPVEFMNEVLSSREAMHLQGDNDQNDASAAAIVLQSYLDRINPPRDTAHEEV